MRFWPGSRIIPGIRFAAEPKAVSFSHRTSVKRRFGRVLSVLVRKTAEESLGPAVEAPPGMGGRFERRRADIVSAAVPILNAQGFKGMTLTAVAEVIGLKATGVTYYFPRKEELAVACFESGIEVFHHLLDEAEKEASPALRVSRLIRLFIERDAAVRRGEVCPLASFSCIRALEGEHRSRVAEGYKAMFRRVRDLMAVEDGTGPGKRARTFRTLSLLEQLYWANTWLADYDIEDFPRIAERMTDVVLHGLAPSGQSYQPSVLQWRPGASETDGAKENFLRAATREINAHGYRGASVDRISASMNVTKGAFYHHIDAKDDLVASCFRRSFGIVRDAQRKVRGKGPDEWWRLTTAVSELVRFQLCDEGPLLRTSAVSSMPHEHQVEIVSLSYQNARQFAAMISDAIAEGSVTPVDPVIAAHLINAAINAASDARPWTVPVGADDPADYARPLFYGILLP
ncbi:MAG: TetR family transcriptional regulator [Alphaproteobacteria bacterium]|nr:TetR family transcriptional regulator [Alphaproteobacteria bacterium]